MSERGSNPPEEKPKAEEAAAGKPRLSHYSIVKRKGRILCSNCMVGM